MAEKPKETSWRTVHRRFNDHMLFAEDLGGRTKVDVEIIDSGVDQVKNQRGTERMPFLAFKNGKGERAAKVLGLNKTNCKAMQQICGTEVIERWRGWITLLVVKVKVKDDDTGQWVMTDAIRIAPQRPQKAAPATQPGAQVAAADPAAATLQGWTPAEKMAIERAEEAADRELDLGEKEEIARLEREANR